MAFRRLPLETNAHIASFLDDRDLRPFSLLCKETRAAIVADRSPLWRELFKRYFDLVPGLHTNKIRRDYQDRKRILRQGANFRKGQTPREKACLKVLIDLMLESYASGNVITDDNGNIKSLNLERIKNFAYDHDILQYVLLPKTSHPGKDFSPFLRTIQVMLAHLQFDHVLKTPTWGFPDSQKAVYESVRKEPIFVGPHKTEVNMQWVAHAVNFFKYHVTREDEGTLFPGYEELREAGMGIKPWRKKLKRGVQTLGKRWRGTYAYLHHHEQAQIRDHAAGEDILEDNFNEHHGGFQGLKLDFTNPSTPTPWPEIFERHLHSKTHPSALGPHHPTRTLHPSSRRTTRSQNPSSSDLLLLHPTPQHASASSSARKANNHDNETSNVNSAAPLNFHFHGTGIDAETFEASGWLNPLPGQCGVAGGWMRWTMMKYFVEADEGSSEDDESSLSLSGGGGTAAGGQGKKGEEAFSWGWNNTAAAAAAAAAVAGDGVGLAERNMWAYEGVVLPGGEVVVGRWWSPGGDGGLEDGLGGEDYSGPFMFWCVD